MHEAEVHGRTLTWLRELVIDQGLCPFARAPYEAGRVRVVVSPASAPELLLAELAAELGQLVGAPPSELETTLLVHPDCLQDFGDYNDFLDVVDALISEQGLEGEIQVASFHPDYRFAGTEPDAAENYTNRSPFPMLHLLREASVTRAVDEHPNVAEIPARNIEHMRATHPAQRERWRRGEPEDQAD